MTDKNGQLVTACIVHLADSADFKGSVFNKFCSGLTVLCFELPMTPYTRTVMQHVKKQNYVKRQN